MFSPFPNLPPELRNQIWQDALPEKDDPAMFLYKKGCWIPRELQPGDMGYDPNTPPNLNFEFRHDLLDPVEVNVPLAFVNREARSVALSWARKQGIAMRFDEQRQCSVFTRCFKIEQDTLYVSMDQWYEFCCEPSERMFEPDMADRHFTCGTAVYHVAVSESLLFTERAPELGDLFEWFLNLKTLYGVADSQPDPRTMHTRLELDIRFPDDKCVWEPSLGYFNRKVGTYGNGDDRYRKVNINQELEQILAGNHITKFDIILGSMIRKPTAYSGPDFAS